MSEETIQGEVLKSAPALPIAQGACMAGGKLAAALAQVIGAMNHVPKNGRHDFHKYDYATESDITNAVRAELAKVNVAVFPSVGEVVVGEADPKDRGGPVTTVELLVTFVHASGEAMTTRWYGQGQDKADKAYYKAYTGAMKYCLLKTFLMSTGDDPEATDGYGKSTRGGSSAPRRPIATSQKKLQQKTARASNDEPTVYSDSKDWQRLNKTIRATLSAAEIGKADADKYLEWVKGLIGAASLTHIPASRLTKVLEHLVGHGPDEAIVEHVLSKITPAKVVDAPEVSA